MGRAETRNALCADVFPRVFFVPNASSVIQNFARTNKYHWTQKRREAQVNKLVIVSLGPVEHPSLLEAFALLSS